MGASSSSTQAGTSICYYATPPNPQQRLASSAAACTPVQFQLRLAHLRIKVHAPGATHVHHGRFNGVASGQVGHADAPPTLVRCSQGRGGGGAGAFRQSWCHALVGAQWQDQCMHGQAVHHRHRGLHLMERHKDCHFMHNLPPKSLATHCSWVPGWRWRSRRSKAGPAGWPPCRGRHRRSRGCWFHRLASLPVIEGSAEEAGCVRQGLGGSRWAGASVTTSCSCWCRFNPRSKLKERKKTDRNEMWRELPSRCCYASSSWS